jgi:hypothetical protein
MGRKSLMGFLTAVVTIVTAMVIYDKFIKGRV